MTREELTKSFEQCRPQLKSFILRMTAGVEDSEDIVQETFIKAYSNINSFKEESSVKTWIFAIASNLAKDFLRSKKRWPENVTDICKEAVLSDPPFFEELMHIRMTSDHGNFEVKEHIAFCFTCVSKSLPLEQHLTVLLKEVYEFKVKEIAEIMSTTEAMVKYYLHIGRTKMIDIFEKRCALINKTGMCHQCTELNGIFNPKQKTQEELVKIDMVRNAENKDKEYLFDLRMKIVQTIDPFESGASELQLFLLTHHKKVMDKLLVEA